MRYRNTITGVIVEVQSEILGNWEPLDAPSKPEIKPEPEKAPEKPVKKARKKKTEG